MTVIGHGNADFAADHGLIRAVEQRARAGDQPLILVDDRDHDQPGGEDPDPGQRHDGNAAQWQAAREQRR
jgi:hypothetical protein